MKPKLKLLIVLLIPLCVIGCVAVDPVTGQREIDWLPTLVMSTLLIIGTVLAAIGLGNALRG